MAAVIQPAHTLAPGPGPGASPRWPWILRPLLVATLASGVSLPVAAAAAPGRGGDPGAAPASGQAALERLLTSGHCPGCRLQEADLVQAPLRRAMLTAADLRRANLSGAVLEGANLRGADLRGASLQGSRLQGADLRGALLTGTDLRHAQLAGARLDPDQLRLSHWQGASGLQPALLSYADLHNAGVGASRQGLPLEAERWFSAAIDRQPEASISWVARGLSRSEQGNLNGAASDFQAAAQRLRAGGDNEQASALEAAARALEPRPEREGGGSSGIGSQLLGGALAVVQLLAPIAARALVPLSF